MGRPGQVPHQFHTGIPTPIDLARHLTIEVPEHSTIEMCRVYTDNIQHLLWQGKAELGSDVRGVLDEGCPLYILIFPNLHLNSNDEYINRMG